MSKAKKISYFIIAGMFLLMGILRLPTLLITTLFAYFILTQLCFGNRKKLAVALFSVMLLAGISAAVLVVQHAIVTLPHMVDAALPVIQTYASKFNVALPFQSPETLRSFVAEQFSGQYANLGHYTKSSLTGIAEFLIGVIVAASLFLSNTIKMEAEAASRPDNIYSAVWAEILERFRTLYLSFARIMGAQFIISLINTCITAIFLLAVSAPYTPLLIVATFVFGLLPIIGNILSNTLIVGLALTVSPMQAGIALLFLVLIHKGEYFLNSKIIGLRINVPLWLTMLALVLGEAILGIPGLILAPMVVYYIKVEASKASIS